MRIGQRRHGNAGCRSAEAAVAETSADAHQPIDRDARLRAQLGHVEAGNRIILDHTAPAATSHFKSAGRR